MMFMKGYTLQGVQGQAYHIHVRYAGHWMSLFSATTSKLPRM